MLTNPPFTRQKDEPPLHLRPWTAEELEQHRRLIEAQEKLRREAQNELQRTESL